MQRHFVAALIVAPMLLTACGSAVSHVPAPAAAVITTPVATSVSAPEQPEAPIRPRPIPQPVVRWYPRGIGLPLTTDDPAAKSRKVAMLTFDDGPSSTDSTARILDVLKEQNVKAVFFVTGAAMKHRDLVEREAKEGHIVAPHSLTHANLTKLTPDRIKKELEPLVSLIQEVTGSRPKYFRPPFGAYNQEVLTVATELGMETVNWTDGSLDWSGLDAQGHKDPKQIVADVMKQLHRGATILLHDTKKHTADALPEVIRQVRAEGYEFVILQ